MVKPFKKRSRQVLTPNEVQILKFIWKMKVVTSSAVHIRFMPLYKWAPYTAYQRLVKLERRKYLSLKYVENWGDFLWTLTTAGFKAIIDQLPPLREMGFESETPRHDIYVLAAHYGNWLPTNTANDVAFITEQELKRQDQETFFDWMPSVKSHRPDGFWYFPKAKPRSLIALEVELNRKTYNDYVNCTEFYNKHTCIESVIWIVQNETLANKIQSAAKEKVVGHREIHNFILVNDFSELGWNAPIFMGPAARSTMQEFLNKQRLLQPYASSTPSLSQNLVQPILDSRLVRFKSNTYIKNAKPENP